MIRTGRNGTIKILTERDLGAYDIVQLEPIDYIYYINGKQYKETRFMCEILI